MEGIFHYLFAEISNILANYWSGTATRIAGAIRPAGYTLLTIYVVLWGWSMIRRAIQEPVGDGVGRIVRMTVIYAIAINMLYYNKFIGDFLWQLPEALAAVVTGDPFDGNEKMLFLDNFLKAFHRMYQAYLNYAEANSSTWLQ
jgi:type IV secretion system protein VirB6